MHAHTRIMRTRTRIHQLKWANTHCLILYGEFTSAIHHCQDLNEFCANAQANKAKLVGRVARTKQTHKAASLDNSHCFGVSCLTGLRHKISRAIRQKKHLITNLLKFKVMNIYLIQAYRNNVALLPAATASKEIAKKLKRGYERNGHTVVIYRYNVTTQDETGKPFVFPTIENYYTLK